MSRPQSVESAPRAALDALLERSADALALDDRDALREVAAEMRWLGVYSPEVRLIASVFARFVDAALRGDFTPLWDLVLTVRLAAERRAGEDGDDAGAVPRFTGTSPDSRARPGTLATARRFPRRIPDSRNASETVGSVPQNLRPSLEFLDGSQNSGAVPGSWRRFPRSGDRREILGTAPQNSRSPAETPGDSLVCPGSWREPRREPRVRELRLVPRDDEPLSE